MEKDKYKAVWLSHSSMKDFLQCPRSYFYKNIYKNPKTGRKITIMKPPLALGQAVHAALDELSVLPSTERFTMPLEKRFEKKWLTISGKRGGFTSEKEEEEYKNRGMEMIRRVSKHPGPLNNKTLKIKETVPYYWFSESENLILCGKLDWLEYIEASDSVHIIDFKTGRTAEREDSLQLPIYYLVATNCQKRPVSKVSYWYLDRSNKPVEMKMPDVEKSEEKIMKIGERIKLSRQLNHFKCAKDKKEGCVYCAPLKAVIEGQGEFVGLGDFREEIYILPDKAVSL